MILSYKILSEDGKIEFKDDSGKTYIFDPHSEKGKKFINIQGVRWYNMLKSMDIEI